MHRNIEGYASDGGSNGLVSVLGWLVLVSAGKKLKCVTEKRREKIGEVERKWGGQRMGLPPLFSFLLLYVLQGAFFSIQTRA